MEFFCLEVVFEIGLEWIVENIPEVLSVVHRREIFCLGVVSCDGSRDFRARSDFLDSATESSEVGAEKRR